MWALADPALNARAGEAGEHEAPWPHLAQVCRVRRQRVDVRTGRDRGGGHLRRHQPAAGAGRRRRGCCALLRGHWGIENRLHWVRDVTFDEDRCPIRTGAAPQAVAACRNLAHRAAAAGRARQHRRRRRAPTPAAPATAIALVATAGRKVMK